MESKTLLIIVSVLVIIGIIFVFSGKSPCPPLGIKPTLTDFYFKDNVAPSYNVTIDKGEFNNITEYDLTAFIFETHSPEISNSRWDENPIYNLEKGDNVFINYTIPQVVKYIPEYYEEKLIGIDLGDLTIMTVYSTKGINITKERIEMLNFPYADFYWEFKHPERKECIIKYKIATYDGEIKTD